MDKQHNSNAAMDRARCMVQSIPRVPANDRGNGD